MKKYQANFTGREVGAIGIFYNISDTVKAENEEDVRLKLYDKYEHISQLTLKEIKEKPMSVEARELYLHTKNFYIEELKKISPECISPIIIIRQIVKKAIDKYIIDYCTKETNPKDIFSQDDFKQVSDKLYEEIMNNEL